METVIFCAVGMHSEIRSGRVMLQWFSLHNVGTLGKYADVAARHLGKESVATLQSIIW